MSANPGRDYAAVQTLEGKRQARGNPRPCNSTSCSTDHAGAPATPIRRFPVRCFSIPHLEIESVAPVVVPEEHSTLRISHIRMHCQSVEMVRQIEPINLE